MDKQELRKQAHDLDVTVWVGKRGVEAVTDELGDQVADRDLVKIKFLPAARADTTVENLAENIAESVGAEVIETRGNTAVVYDG
jgi:RNA-binding protein